ncbi:MAG: sigma-54-dependent Fis family transcriptional regulator [Bacteroidales bacterium]|nr:sigma-54-dependent Fis family transcriptional regulator [Bacteroidales bacterium]
MKPYKIFVVDDDKMYAQILSYQLLQNPDYQVEVFETARSCINNLHKSPDLITLDYSLPDLTGMEALKKIRDVRPDIPVIIISGQKEISTAIELLKYGAYDYIIKNKDTKNTLWNTVKNARENHFLKKEVAILRKEVGEKYSISKGIIGNSGVMKRVFAIIDKAVKSNITVSITGETGTGKEVVAKAIHYNSARAKKPFIVVNVSAIPEDLIESEMFGHEKGAFTGADKRRIGKFELAEEGTLFLDEIGEMSLAMQAKLLRVIQERELNRVGGNEMININVRIIIATNKNLLDEVKKGNFREDLYYRLLGLPIELPPLRDRGNDKMLLAKYFVNIYCKENNVKDIAISSGAQAKIMNYPFPGNVREMKAVVELASVLAEKNVINIDDITFRNLNPLTDILSYDMTLEEYNVNIIKNYVEKYNGNITAAANALDIGKSTIYRLKKKGVLDV